MSASSEKTPKNYTSPNSGEPCTCAQYIAEIVTKREADKKRIVLRNKWWNHEPWRKKYASQVMAANSLLKLYDEIAIIRALGRKECSWQWSLRTQNLHDFFREEQQKLDKERELANNTVEIQTSATEFEIKPTFGKQSKRSKLRD
jgi:hypothetical protein